MVMFVYGPLSRAERQIRLLELLPGAGAIRCEVWTQSLFVATAHRNYEALSYCWGVAKASKEIFVNGLTFLITPNLHAALLRLREPDGGQPRALWIDAVCIDQKNLEEKSSQIPLMREIYSSCSRVVIWVGEHDVLTKSALEGINFMASRHDHGEHFNYYDWKKVRRKKSSKIPLKDAAEGLTSSAAITSLFSRPWFTRVWVIQELTLSPDAIVMCGKFQIQWDQVAKANRVSKTNFEHDLGTLSRFRTWPPVLSNDIFNRMVMAWHMEAQNPRDKIYGLMGLEDAPLGEALDAVDYTANVEHVFIQFTRAYIEQFGNLQVLALCRGCRPLSTTQVYPSWAIDYHFDRSRDSMPESLISWGFDKWKGYPQGLCAGGHKRSRPTMADGVLKVDGHTFDVVTVLSMVQSSTAKSTWSAPGTGKLAYLVNATKFYPHFVAHLLASCRSALDFSQFYIDAKRLCSKVSSNGIYHPTQQTTNDAFWQVIRGREIPIDHADCDAGTRALFQRVDQLLTGNNTRGASFPIAKITQAIAKEPGLFSFFAQTGLPKQRRFVITRKGYMGLAPRESQVGDSIILLQGHIAPVIARKAGFARWSIVGECYVHGIMGGEAFHEEECETLHFE